MSNKDVPFFRKKNRRKCSLPSCTGRYAKKKYMEYSNRSVYVYMVIIARLA